MNTRPTARHRAALPQLHRLQYWILRLMAREDVNMVVVQSSSGNHKTVGMECGRRDWSAAIAQEAGVGFEIGDELAVVDVEDLDAVFLSSTEEALEDGRYEMG
jgi:hypothetical protein